MVTKRAQQLQVLVIKDPLVRTNGTSSALETFIDRGLYKLAFYLLTNIEVSGLVRCPKCKFHAKNSINIHSQFLVILLTNKPNNQRASKHSPPRSRCLKHLLLGGVTK